jgi:hypothetical protein
MLKKRCISYRGYIMSKYAEWIVIKTCKLKPDAEEFMKKQNNLSAKYYLRPLILVDNVDEWLVITDKRGKDLR